MKRLASYSLRIFVSAILAFAFSGCASTANTYSNAAPGSDFTRYSTFGFYDSLSTNRGDYETMETNFLKVAVAQQLDKRGMTYTDDSPDLLVNFYIHTEEKIISRSVPTTGAYYGYRDPFYDTWGGYGMYETRIEQHTEGTLHIDVVDASTKKLVWEGAIVGRITDRVIRNLEKSIDEAVSATMANFPVQP